MVGECRATCELVWSCAIPRGRSSRDRKDMVDGPTILATSSKTSNKIKLRRDELCQVVLR